jgi:hypothetical protein
MSQAIVNDLAKTAVERARKSVMLVTQLLDDDEDIAIVLMAVAADMVSGAAFTLTNDDTSEHEAMNRVVRTVFGAFGKVEIVSTQRGSRSCGD